MAGKRRESAEKQPGKCRKTGEHMPSATREFPPPHRHSQPPSFSYRCSKVIHGWRGEPKDYSPQPAVSNFAPPKNSPVNNTAFPATMPGITPGPEDESSPQNVARFNEDFRSGSRCFDAKELSEPFACPSRRQRRTCYKDFPPSKPACSKKIK